MAKVQYIAVMEGGVKEGYGVWFPDLPGCVSAGSTEAEARENAAEALTLHLEGMIEDREALPAPSSIHSIGPEDVGPGFLYLFVVEAETAGAPSEGYTRINITLPTGLWERVIRASGGNRSGWLAEAARDRLARERQKAN